MDLIEIIGLSILSLIAKGILYFIGWKLPTYEEFQKFNKHQRCVAVFSHTSYIDFILLLIYYTGFPEEFANIRVLVVPWAFEYVGWLLKKIGGIPATKLSDKNGGAVHRIVSELEQHDRFIFLISPKGTILKYEWRSGYFNVAKAFNAHFMVVGLDYDKKRVFVSDAIKFEDDEIKVKQHLYKELSKIVPLFPECEIVKIREHDYYKRGIFDWNNIINVFLAIFIVYKIITSIGCTLISC